MDELVSVIIPVYNVESYIEECLDSVVRQTYNNLEIIVIDDGSTDNSGTICDEYEEKDSRIKVIHQCNGGLSAARNTGLNQMSGSYIVFVDSDDKIDINMVEILLNILKENDSDIALGNIVPFSDNGTFDSKELSPIKDEILSAYEFFIKLTEAQNQYYTVAWNKLYRKEVYEGIRFPSGYIHEDEAVIHYVIDKCRKIACTKNNIYYYRKRENSIMGEGKSIRKTDILTALADRIQFFNMKKKKDLRTKTVRRYVDVFFYWINELIYNYEKDNIYRVRVKESLKKVLPLVWKTNGIRITQKIWMTIINCNESFYMKVNSFIRRK